MIQTGAPLQGDALAPIMGNERNQHMKRPSMSKSAKSRRVESGLERLEELSEQMEACVKQVVANAVIDDCGDIKVTAKLLYSCADQLWGLEKKLLVAAKPIVTAEKPKPRGDRPGPKLLERLMNKPLREATKVGAVIRSAQTRAAKPGAVIVEARAPKRR